MQQYCEIPTPKGIMRGFFHTPSLQQFPVCLIFHGFTGNCMGTKYSYVQLARKLEEKGIGTLRMDFLGSGESDLEFKDMTFDDELSCARLLLEEVKKLPTTSKIYVLGHSMGGVIASELAKIYPDDIEKLCLWAPAFHLPTATDYLIGNAEQSEYYDHNGFEISDAFIQDLKKRDFYKNLDIYKNRLMIIHGDEDTTVPFELSKKYRPLFTHPSYLKFVRIHHANHTFDNVVDIQNVLRYTISFLSDAL